MSEPHAIEAISLSKRYRRVEAVREVSFEVAKGEIVGFLGPNGAGKSTTLRILCGLLPATSGIARINGVNVATDPQAVKKHIGYMPENNPLPEDLRVGEYLRFRAALKEVPGNKRRRRVEEVMDLCDLRGKVGRKLIGSLSKGFRQRVGIADAILSEPAVAILDEPTIGLDPHQIIVIRELLRSLRGKMTLIISSHILSEIEACCDQVIILNQGRIITAGTPDELRDQFLDARRYDIEAQGDLQGFIRIVRTIEPQARLSGLTKEANRDGFHELSVEVPHGRDIGEAILRRTASATGIVVRSLSRRQASLEDIFLAATRRAGTDGAPPWKAPIVETNGLATEDQHPA